MKNHTEIYYGIIALISLAGIVLRIDTNTIILILGIITVIFTPIFIYKMIIGFKEKKYVSLFGKRQSKLQERKRLTAIIFVFLDITILIIINLLILLYFINQ